MKKLFLTAAAVAALSLQGYADRIEVPHQGSGMSGDDAYVTATFSCGQADKENKTARVDYTFTATSDNHISVSATFTDLESSVFIGLVDPCYLFIEGVGETSLTLANGTYTATTAGTFTEGQTYSGWFKRMSAADWYGGDLLFPFSFTYTAGSGSGETPSTPEDSDLPDPVTVQMTTTGKVFDGSSLVDSDVTISLTATELSGGKLRIKIALVGDVTGFVPNVTVNGTNKGDASGDFTFEGFSSGDTFDIIPAYAAASGGQGTWDKITYTYGSAKVTPWYRIILDKTNTVAQAHQITIPYTIRPSYSLDLSSYSLEAWVGYDGKDSAHASGASGNIVVTDLSQAHTYGFYAKFSGTDADGNSIDSYRLNNDVHQLDVTTLEDVTELEFNVELYDVTTTNNSISGSYRFVPTIADSDLTGYTFRLWLDVEGFANAEEYSNGQTGTFSITGLSENTSYNLWEKSYYTAPNASEAQAKTFNHVWSYKTLAASVDLESTATATMTTTAKVFDGTALVDQDVTLVLDLTPDASGNLTVKMTVADAPAGFVPNVTVGTVNKGNPTGEFTFDGFTVGQELKIVPAFASANGGQGTWDPITFLYGQNMILPWYRIVLDGDNTKVRFTSANIPYTIKPSVDGTDLSDYTIQAWIGHDGADCDKVTGTAGTIAVTDLAKDNTYNMYAKFSGTDANGKSINDYRINSDTHQLTLSTALKYDVKFSNVQIEATKITLDYEFVSSIDFTDDEFADQTFTVTLTAVNAGTVASAPNTRAGELTATATGRTGTITLEGLEPSTNYTVTQSSSYTYDGTTYQTSTHNSTQSYATGIVTGVDSIDADMAAQARYFNLQGQAVQNPGKGQILIRVLNGKAAKVIL